MRALAVTIRRQRHKVQVGTPSPYGSTSHARLTPRIVTNGRLCLRNHSTSMGHAICTAGCATRNLLVFKFEDDHLHKRPVTVCGGFEPHLAHSRTGQSCANVIP